MGSGLILLVIVGCWLAVLVPMALKSHDTTASLKSADRFSDAMRVLSGRPKPVAGDRRDVVMPRRPPHPPVLSGSPKPGRPPLPASVAPDGPTQAERRRRTLLVLLGLALVTLGLALLGSSLLLVAHLLCDLLLLGFVAHCRRQAVLKAQRRARERTRQLPVDPAVARSPRVAGIPDRMPARPLPAVAPPAVPAARYDDAVPATGTTGLGDAWEPVPVPPPTYVGKPAAPPRRHRVLDLTKPGEWTAALEADDAGLGIFDDERELEGIIGRRRAVNDW